MDTKVRYVGVGCKFPNTKVYGRVFGHRKKTKH